MKRIAAALAIALAATTAGAYAMSGYPSIAVPKYVPPLDPSFGDDGWKQTAGAHLVWDVVHGRPITEATNAWIATDGKALYVRFDAKQKEPIAASQHTNDVGQGNDDGVWIDLWPNGASGYMYQFQVTPNGTHYEMSSENTSYSPTWESHGTTTADGYTVTMRIPLEVIRGGSATHPWNVQFARFVHATGEQQVWSYDSAQNNPDDFSRSGTMTMPLVDVAAPHPKPRLATYVLGEAASKSIGGSTSRVGADLSIPITPTASFYSTFHPDYSNVELDQQSIAPTVFARYQNEVRPFFTQGANFYNQFNCDACPAIQELYTPAIPTPASGYAVEGKQGPFSLATFDAVGDGRNDLASALGWTSTDQKWNFSTQRVSVNTPTLTDNVLTTGLSYYDHKHLSAYFDYGDDSGTNVLDGSQAQRYDFGGGWGGQTFGFWGSTRKVGEYYNPADGFVSHPGIAGYALYSAKIWDFSANSKIDTIGVAGFVDRYQGPQYGQAQSDNQLIFDVLTKSAWDLQLFTGSDYWRFNNLLEPISQNGGFQLTYHSGLTTNNPGNFPNHGTAATPTLISYSTGNYGSGHLDTWFRSTTMRVGNRGSLTLAIDDTAQYFPNSPSNVQWFNSLSYSYQIGLNSAFAIGLRRVTGTPPVPNGGGNCVGECSNVSVAYHLRTRHIEYYLAYGNPNALTTVPSAIFKMIFYAGAEKGT
ncbi:MAG: hypothetical protein JO199_08485 [Candidatus Eremiobacteraeota bacterium]|nr:hypothetical protein [Candidatus Eremiobacteraeota bacterium]